MPKVLVALNDGTDEILNLHAFHMDNRAELYMDWGDCFLSACLISEWVDENQIDPLSTPSEIVDYDADGRCSFLISDLPMELVVGTIDGQGAKYGRAGARGFREEDFTMSWKDVLAEMGWSPGKN